MSVNALTPEYYMNEALKQAQLAFEGGEIPVGAVVVCRNKIIAKAHNQVELLQDPTAHAEMLAFTAASHYLGSKFLNECTLYVTLEPCVMCAGASFWTQLKEIYYGAPDPKRGFLRAGNEILHPKTKITGGVLGEPSAQLLHLFFAKLRDSGI